MDRREMINKSLGLLAGSVLFNGSRFQEEKSHLERLIDIKVVSEIDFKNYLDPAQLKNSEIQPYFDSLRDDFANIVRKKDQKLGDLLSKVKVRYDEEKEYRYDIIRKIIEDKKFYENNNLNIKFEDNDYNFDTFMRSIEKEDIPNKDKTKKLPNMAVPYSLVNIGKGHVEKVYVFPGIIKLLKNRLISGAKSSEERNTLAASYLGHEFYHVLSVSEGLGNQGEKITLKNSDLLGVKEKDFPDLFKLTNEYNAYTYQLRDLKNPRLKRVVENQLRPWKIGLGSRVASYPKIKKLLLK